MTTLRYTTRGGFDVCRHEQPVDFESAAARGQQTIDTARSILQR